MSSSALCRRVLAAYADAYGAPPVTVVRAPGRVNLIGEHTDYNDGYVLPCAIDCQTLVAAAPRTDALVRVVAANWGHALDEFRIDAPIPRRPDAPWADYVRGVVATLLAEGAVLGGAELALCGDIPQGAGLSSSAALEVAVAQAFKSLCRLQGLDPTRLALIAQRAENEFVGCNCGIMDQLASARGQAGHALLIDCRSLQTTPVAWPPELALMIVHSRVVRGLVDSAYNSRRAQCEQVARHFGVPALRDLDPHRLEAGAAGLGAQAGRTDGGVACVDTR